MSRPEPPSIFNKVPTRCRPLRNLGSLGRQAARTAELWITSLGCDGDRLHANIWLRRSSRAVLRFFWSSRPLEEPGSHKGLQIGADKSHVAQ